MNKNDYDNIYNWLNYIVKVEIRTEYIKEEKPNWFVDLKDSGVRSMITTLYIPGKYEACESHQIIIKDFFNVESENGKSKLFYVPKKAEIEYYHCDCDDFNQILEDFFSVSFDKISFNQFCINNAVDVLKQTLIDEIKREFGGNHLSKENMKLVNSVETNFHAEMTELLEKLDNAQYASLANRFNESHFNKNVVGCDVSDVANIYQAIKTAETLYLYDSLQKDLGVNSASSKKPKI